ncbi:MAG: hypothetical protein QOG18_1153, partial [Microbacteriaceae bacterium]|nr:hypothetical protein [Microbacteriaceae bacterium]
MKQKIIMTMDRIGHRITSINPSPLLKQVPTLIPCLIAAVLVTMSTDVAITDLPSVVGGGIGIVVATIVAWMLTTNVRWQRYILAVPAIDVLAISALEHGTNSVNSVIAAGTIVPLLWFTAEAGRRHLTLSVAGTLLIVFAAYRLFNGRAELPNAVELARDRFTFVVICTLSCVVIFGVMLQARRRLDAIELMLAESRAHAETLRKSEARASAAEGLLRGLW